MRLCIHLPIGWVIFLKDTFWDAHSLPFRPSVVHSVHQFPVPSDVFRVCIRAMPVAVLGLLSNLACPWYKLTVSKHIGPRPCNAPFFFVVIADIDVAMHVHVNLTINLEGFMHLLKSCLFIIIHPFYLWVLLTFYVLSVPCSFLLSFDNIFVHFIYLL